ncbi:MAG: glycosyltransferase [Chitinivibrionales bacterium]
MPIRAEEMLKRVDKVEFDHKDAGFHDSLSEQVIIEKGRIEPLCTLNMIVRDEAENIGNALDSIDECVDEIVINDTGSVDETPEICGLYGVKLIRNTWKGDFSLHRNQAVRESRGRYILWMDADDVLDESSKGSLISILKSHDTATHLFSVVNTRSGRPPVDFIQARLFPNNSGIHFENRIHEQIMNSSKRAGVPFRSSSNIRIIHSGYDTGERVKEKTERNMHLIQEELEKDQNNGVMRFSLAEALLTQGRNKTALAEYIKAINTPGLRDINPDVYAQAMVSAGALFLKEERPERACDMFTNALDIDPYRIDACYYMGILNRKRGLHTEAFSFFMKASRIRPRVRLTATDNLRFKLDCVYYIIEYLTQWERLDEAESILKAAMHDHPRVVSFYNQMGRLFLSRRRVREAARYFMYSISMCPDNNKGAYIGMSCIYDMLGDKESSESYRSRGNDTA